MNHVNWSSVSRDMTGSVIGYVLDRVDIRDDKKWHAILLVRKRHIVSIGQNCCRFCWSKLLSFYLVRSTVVFSQSICRFCRCGLSSFLLKLHVVFINNQFWPKFDHVYFIPFWPIFMQDDLVSLKNIFLGFKILFLIFDSILWI